MPREKFDSDIGDAPPAPTPAERVESWKEIAAYLQRDVRTVQRWEKSEALPVYRHMHDERGTVYAYKAELDAWWSNRRPRLELEVEKGEATEPARARPLAKRRLWLGAVAGVLVVAVGAGVWLMRAPRLAFQERGWALIARFENRTGEAIFGDTLEYALERELSNSQFVNVVPPERVQDALLLMRKPRDTRLDIVIAREVALRDGNTQIVLTGRIEKFGSSYELTSLLVNPSDGAVLRSVSEEATGQDAVLGAVRRLSNRVRQNLGEELGRIQQQGQALEKATTPSLRALQFYSQGMAFVDRLDWNGAIPLLEQAVAADPDFASAHIYLAHCYSNVGKTQEAAPHYQRAFQLADKTSDRERYFILGSYYDRFLLDLNKAVETYQVLVRLYPDHYWGVNNLAITLDELDRAEEALPYAIARAELRPNDLAANFNAFFLLWRLGKDDAVEYKRFLERAQNLATPEEAQRRPLLWTQAQTGRAYQHLARRELPQALAEIERVAKAFDTLEGLARDPRAVINLTYWYRQLGRLHAAERYYDGLPTDWRHYGLSAVAELRGDRKALREHLRKQIAAGGELLTPWSAARCARAGLLREARNILSLPRMREYNVVDLQIARGELALAEGRPDDAAKQLRQAFSLALQKPSVLWASDALARALEARGDLPGAIEALRQGLGKNLWRANLENIAWNKLHLLRLHRKLGHEREARELERDLLELLAYADPDHPILLQLKQSQEMAGAQPR